MITINPYNTSPIPHSLMANKKLKGFEKGVIKGCYVTRYSEGRFAVMAISSLDYFYMVLADEKELHDTFNEQLSIPS